MKLVFFTLGLVVWLAANLLASSYASLSMSELKRQAKTSAKLRKIYTLRARYGIEVWLLLWLLSGFGVGLMFWQIFSTFWFWVALIFFAFSYLAGRLAGLKPAVFSQYAVMLSGPLDFVLRYIHPALK